MKLKAYKLVALIMLLTLCCSTVQALDVSEAQLSFFRKTNVHSPLLGKTSVISSFANDRGSYMHQGIDVTAPMYTPVYAVADGIITKAAPDSKGVNAGGGHMIFIDHEDGTASWYMHLSAYGVEEGDRVRAGDLIALSGNSGAVTGPHLHYEYRVNNIPVDPYFIFELFNCFERGFSPATLLATFQVVQQ